MPEHVGGTELYTQTLARYQVQMGHSAAIFTPSATTPTGTAPSAQDEDGVRVYRAGLGAHGRFQVFRNTFSNKQLDGAFTAVLAQEKPDIIHIQHLMGLPPSLIERIQAAAIPYVITLHDYWYGCANAQLIANDSGDICAGPDKTYRNCGRCAIARAGKANLAWLSPMVAPLMRYRNGRLRRIITQAYKVIAPTRFVQTIYQQMGFPDDNFIVIQHGIEVPEEKIERILRERPSSPPHTLHIGYIGSIAHQKGIHHLITAVNQLPHDGVKLTLYGGLDAFPEYVAHLRQLIRHPGIQLAGRIARDKIWAAFASFDVVAMPTLWYEASPLTIQEAFAVKTPIVASRIGAMPDKITHGIDGLLVPPGDVDALRAALLSLLENPTLLPQLQSGIKPVYTMTQQARDINIVYTNATHT